MPAGEGWFIDLRSGRAIDIDEHATAVAKDPARYRIRPCEIRGLIPTAPAHRARILRLAFKRGFVRVRADKGRVVAEFDAADHARVVRRIDRFLKAKGFGELAVIAIHNLQRPRLNFAGLAKDLSRNINKET
jgi:hypothetical protein